VRSTSVPWHVVTSAVCSCCWRAGGATPTWGSAERRLARAGTKVSRSLCNMQRQRAPSLTYMLCVAVVQVDGRWWRSAPGGGFWRHFAAGDRRLGGRKCFAVNYGARRSQQRPWAETPRVGWVVGGRRRVVEGNICLFASRLRTGILTGDWRFSVLSCASTLQLLSLQPAVPRLVRLERVMPSFSLRKTGGWKARYFSSRARFRTAVLTGDWRFQRSPVPQRFSSSVYSLSRRVKLV